MLAAVNHSGESDSTGAVAGTIIGVQSGIEAIPDEWLAGLEMKDLIEEVATDLFDRFPPCDRDARQPACQG